MATCSVRRSSSGLPGPAEWSTRNCSPSRPGCADDIAVIRSMYTEHNNHEQALWMMHTGRIVSGRPNLGAWVSYALGSENQNLPAYVVLRNDTAMPVDGARNWSSGFLPPRYQGVHLPAHGHPCALPRDRASSCHSERTTIAQGPAARAECRAPRPQPKHRRRPGSADRQLRAGRADAVARRRRARSGTGERRDASRSTESTSPGPTATAGAV